jgi:hypothetical protein
MKLTKESLQKIIQEEIENLMSEEEKTPLQKAVIAAKPSADAPMSAQGDRLPRWLDMELKDLVKDFPELANLKGKKLKDALGIGTEESEYEKRRQALLQKGK